MRLSLHFQSERAPDVYKMQEVFPTPSFQCCSQQQRPVGKLCPLEHKPAQKRNPDSNENVAEQQTSDAREDQNIGHSLAHQGRYASGHRSTSHHAPDDRSQDTPSV